MCCPEAEPRARGLAEHPSGAGAGAGDRGEESRPSLRRFARECIDHYLDTHRLPPIELDSMPPGWLEPRGCFVTLQMDGELRGCVGTFDWEQPLAINVARTACRTAFEDPRFEPVSRDELPRLEVEISLLSPPEPFPVANRQDLIARLRPGRDGLIVREGGRRATFLPAVWDSLPDPADFVDALFAKAGLPSGHWSPRLRFERYEATKAD